MSQLSPPRKLKLGLASAGMLMTPEEFDAVTRYDERYRYELIKEVLVVTRLPAEAESDPNDELGARRETTAVPRTGGDGILDHRPVPAHDDCIPPQSAGERP
ncbi:MAG: hypothetical protein ACLQVF_23635 [Isosphaeraceae bacterium]